jgi:two-component system sensor histidine kinase LytS
LIEAVFTGAILLLAAIALAAVFAHGHWLVTLVCALGVIALVPFMIRYSIDPDRLRARQSERMLKIAANTLPYMRSGLNADSASEVCRLILPATSANAVVITDHQKILGYVGAEKETHQIGSPIQTEATRMSLRNAEMSVVTSKEDIGFSQMNTSFHAAVIVPIFQAEEVVGVLKFYYRSAKRIDETEQAVAQGLASLLSMQLGLAELDYQRELAAKMELRALQAQINPHFLFNTINTIAALIRTDPAQARILLREFATFYRRTLEGSLDDISLEQEYIQTLRYLGFEIARFGSERIQMTTDIEKGLEDMRVPAFIIQPLVENAVGHGMREQDPLHVKIRAYTADGNVIIEISDDGRGIPKGKLEHMFEFDSNNGSVALKNVDDRLRGFFGSKARLTIQSEFGKGTKVLMSLGPRDLSKDDA